MKNQMELAVEKRDKSGKKVRFLRRQGLVPAVMYGHNQSSISLQVSRAALRKLLDHGGSNMIFSLKIGNRPGVQALIKNIQYDPISREIAHLEFYRVAETETLKTLVQLQFVNEAPAVKLAGATVLHALSEVSVECLPADLPSSIQVDLSQLKEPGDVIRVENLKAPPGVTILNAANDVVASAQQARVAAAEEAEAAPEAAPAEPEAAA